MKSEFESFEERIKNKILSKNKIPEDSLWNKINSELVKRENARKRRFLILYSSIGLSVLIGIILLIWAKSDSKEIAANSLNMKKQNQTEISKSSKTKSKITSESNKSKNSELLKSDSSKNENINSPNLTLKYTKKGNLVSENSNEKEGNKTVIYGSYSEKINQIKVIDRVKINENLNYELKSESLLKNEVTNGNSTIKNDLVDDTKIKEFKKTNEDLVLYEFSKMKILNLQLINSSKVPNLVGKIKHPNVSTPRKIYVGLEIMPQYSHRNLDKFTTQNQLYNSLIENEKGSFNSNYGLSFGMRLNHNFSIKTGISCMSFSTTFTSNNLAVVYDSNSNILTFQTEYDELNLSTEDFYSEDPDETQEIEIDSEDTTLATLQYVNKNSIQIIKIPLILEYSYNLKNLRLFLSSGISVGRVANAYSTIETLGFTSERNNLSPKMNKWLIGNSFDLGAEYFVSKHISISGSANFNYSINAINNTSQFKTKPYWVGLHTGLRYYIK